jgi:hypothetical protein
MPILPARPGRAGARLVLILAESGINAEDAYPASRCGP